MDLREQNTGAVDPGQHWYYRTKKLPLLSYFDELLRQNPTLDLVDIGAGSCFFSECLIEHGGHRLRDVFQIDTGFAQEEALPDPRISGRHVRAWSPPANMRGALIVMMDVLEHVENDAGFLAAITDRCRGENRFFITVPASMSLWSSHDEFLGHHRRYDLDDLCRLAAAAGIVVTSAYYLYASIFPLVWLKRRWPGRTEEPKSDLEPTSKPISFALELLCRSEFIARRCNRMFGVTCVLEGSHNAAAAPAPQEKQ